MSLIIKGINMPKNGEMTIAFASDENGENTLALILDTSGKPIKHKGVAEIPTPHGRLIDADDVLRNNAIFADREFIHPSMQVTLREIIDEAPTIIKAEVSG